MNFEGLLNKNLTAEEKIAITVAQGNEVLKILNTEGWKIIEMRLWQKKALAEKDRKKEVRLQSTREKSLYWDGFVDGIEEARESIYDIVQEAFNAQKVQDMLKEHQEEKNNA